MNVKRNIETIRNHSSGQPLNDPASLPRLSPGLRSLSLVNLPIGPTLAGPLTALPHLTDLGIDRCHVDLRAAAFPWPRLQRLSARHATLGASHSQLVQLARSPQLVAVDLHDARLYDQAACGVEYLSFTFKRCAIVPGMMWSFGGILVVCLGIRCSPMYPLAIT